MPNETFSTSGATWSGPFDPQTYEAAREILKADQAHVANEVRGVGRKRGRIVGIVAIIWVICTLALVAMNADWLLIAEIGWVAIVVWGVFWLLPALMGRANLEDMYSQYADQLAKLEAAHIPMPRPSSIEDLIAAIDFVSPAEGK